MPDPDPPVLEFDEIVSIGPAEIDGRRVTLIEGWNDGKCVWTGYVPAGEDGDMTLTEELRKGVQNDGYEFDVDAANEVMLRAAAEIEQLQGVIAVHTAPQTGTQSGGASFGFGNTKGACPTCGKWF